MGLTRDGPGGAHRHPTCFLTRLLLVWPDPGGTLGRMHKIVRSLTEKQETKRKQNYFSQKVGAL